MHDTPTTPLPGSWLTSRLGVDPREIEESAKERRALRRPRPGGMALPGLAVRPGRLDPRRRPQRGQGGARGRARRGAPRGPAAPPGRPRRRRPAARPALRGPLRLRRRRRPQRRNGVNRVRGPRTLAPCASCSSRRCTRGPDAPDLGTFVAQVERELVARGHEVELAVLDTRAGGKLRYLTLARRTLRGEPARRRLRALPRADRPDRRARGRARRSSSPRTGGTCATSARSPASRRRPGSSCAARRP